MARVSLPHTVATTAGTTVTATAGDATNGHTMVNDGKVRILLENTGASSRTATITTPGTVDSLAIADRTITVAAGVSKLCGPFPIEQYGNPLLIDESHAELTLVAIR